MTKKEIDFKLDVEEMARAGLHFGHRTSRIHPKIKPYLYGVRNGVHIIDLEMTCEKLKEALGFIKELISEGKILLLVGTKIQVKNLVKEVAEECGLPYIIERWLGGTFTNFEIIKKRLEYFKDLENESEELILEGKPQAHQNFGSQNLGGQAVIVEIRAGTGGEEASLFAGDLFRMYSKYGESCGWQQKTLDSHPSELRGFKEIIFELKSAGAGGGDVFSKMKYEGGVHRVQRIPETEKGGRIHTSTASVAVLLKPKKTEIKINPQDLKIDFYGASGPGGQYVQKRHTAVRIAHLPTGIIVTSQTERNQLQNKENAMAILEARLLKKKEMQELEKISGKRKAQIGWAKRAEKIRTYNFPQDRVTDHRIKKSWHNLEKILNGELDPVIKTLQKSLPAS